jgi:hypothetical protein
MKYFRINFNLNRPYAGIHVAYDESRRDYPDFTLPASGAVSYIIQGTGKRWLDFIADTGRLSILLCKREIAEDIKKFGITGVEFYPANLYKIWSKTMAGVQPVPEYVWGRIVGEAKFDVRLDNGKPYPLHGSFDHYHLGDVMGAKRLHLEKDNWDGTDLFRPTNVIGHYRFCSQRFVDLCQEHKWENIWFHPQEPDGSLRL